LSGKFPGNRLHNTPAPANIVGRHRKPSHIPCTEPLLKASLPSSRPCNPPGLAVYSPISVGFRLCSGSPKKRPEAATSGLFHPFLPGLSPFKKRNQIQRKKTLYKMPEK
jgi:hypothetical protein